MGDCYYNCHVCGTPLHHINEACPNCLPRMAERPPTFICPSCSAKEAEIARLREALSEMTAARDECCKTIAELRRRAKEG